MDRKTVVLGSFICFIMGLAIIIWTNLVFSPDLEDICDISPGLVSTQGVFNNDYLEDECRVKLVFPSSKPSQGQDIVVIGEYDKDNISVFEWEII